MGTAFRGTARRAYMFGARVYLSPMLKREWRSPFIASGPNERVIEYRFAFEALNDCMPTDILDVGSGLTSWPHLLANCGFKVTAIDEARGYWGRPLFNRHFYVQSDDIIKPRRVDGLYDFVSCISVMQHITDHVAAAKSILTLVRPGGHALFTFPYNARQYIPNVYELPGSTFGDARYKCQLLSDINIRDWLAAVPSEIVRQEYFKVFSGDFWSFGTRLVPPRRVGMDDEHDHTCLLLKRV